MSYDALNAHFLLELSPPKGQATGSTPVGNTIQDKGLTSSDANPLAVFGFSALVGSATPLNVLGRNITHNTPR